MAALICIIYANPCYHIHENISIQFIDPVNLGVDVEMTNVWQTVIGLCEKL